MSGPRAGAAHRVRLTSITSGIQYEAVGSESVEIGIMGLPGAGKTTVFNALAHARATVGGYSAPSAEPNLAVVKVPDPRLDQLAPLFEPKTFTPAEVQYVVVAGIVRGSGKESSAGALLAHL